MRQKTDPQQAREETLRLPDRPGKILEDYIPAQEWSWRGCELFIMYPSGEDYAENSYPLDENADTVSFSLPDGIDLSTIQVLNLYFNARYAEGMQWVLDPAIYYFVDNDNGIRDIQTRISFYKSGKTIDWIFADDKISVSVLNRVDESSYWLVSARYDAKTGQCIYWNKVLNGP